MFRRRKDSRQDEPVDEAAETSEDVVPDVAAAVGVDDADDEDRPKSERPDGPWDVDEVDLEADSARGRIDLGGLLIRGGEGMQLQLQVEQATQRVTAALVVAGDSAVQLMAIAAPRSSGIWDDTRAEMRQDAGRRGATVEDIDGAFGSELRVVLPVTMPDGTQGVQPSRQAGIDGPRWLLRATFLGRATAEQAAYDRMVAVVKDTVVVRGDIPMAPGDLVALHVPVGAADTAEPDEPPAEPPKPRLEDLDPGPTVTEIR